MNVGIETISWGIRLKNIRETLDLIAAAGYKGVEFAQRPDALGVANVEELIKLLEERDLTLLSIVGGTLQERLRFLGARKPEYIYVEHWDLEKINPAQIAEHRLAFHPRAFMPNGRLSDVLKLMNMYPDLWYAIDVAHLTAVGDDPIVAIRELQARLAVIHLKDWFPGHGRSYYRFARGFTVLGEGEVRVKDAVDELRKLGYTGWLVAELDNPRQGITRCVFDNAQWLAKSGLMTVKDPTASPEDEAVGYLGRPSSVRCLPENEAWFQQELLNSMQGDLEGFHYGVTRAFSHLIKCRLVTLSTHSSPRHISVRACFPDNTSNTLHKQNQLASVTAERQALVTRYDLTKDGPALKYGFPDQQFWDPQLIQELGLSAMISVPIYNSSNPNTVRYVVDLFPDDDAVDLSDEEIFWFGQQVTLASDAILDAHCLSAETQTSLVAAKCADFAEFLQQLMRTIQSVIGCEGVAIFTENDERNQLVLQKEMTTGTNWHVTGDQQYYEPGDGHLTTSVWERNETIISDTEDWPGHSGKSTELVNTPDQNNVLWVPLRAASNQAIGVVRCRNKQTGGTNHGIRMFTYDDASILEAMVSAATPHLSLLLGDYRRIRTMDYLLHELANPLVVIRGAVEDLMSDQSLRQQARFDFVSDIWSWSELMARQLLTAQTYVNDDSYTVSRSQLYWQRVLRLRPERTHLSRIVAPAVRQVTMLLNERGFSKRNITYSRFEKIPDLYLDPSAFQQVTFNLLTNSIKHCYDDPSSFQVEIDGPASEDDYLLVVRDYGPGIDERLREKIFEKGYRGLSARKRGIQGAGLGLWLVRSIVQAHGGRIIVTHCRQPLELTIFLPKSLAERPPSSQPT